MTNLFVKLFRDSLSEYSYQAELAELDYELAGSMFNSTRLQSIYGLTLTFSGFNDKMGVFLNSFFEKLTSFKVDSQRFSLLKESVSFKWVKLKFSRTIIIIQYFNSINWT